MAQQRNAGIITGNLLDEKSRALTGASLELVSAIDSTQRKTTLSDKDGNFSLTDLPFGVYRLKLSFIGYMPLVLDSINIRPERFDFNLNDLVLKPGASGSLAEVVVYPEKPLVQSKDGNVIFNAGESALSAGSNAADLLKNVPLVSTDPNGKLLVRGKEPKILIDDKPVELNLQQLQDFLESLPGSSIEKIEVLTNPPPQYANEQGGVINIVTRKGKVGMGGRATITAGSRGEAVFNGNISYRKNKLAINFNAGAGYNRFTGDGYAHRQNVYTDSTNYFNSSYTYNNRSTRPSARLNIDYDISKQQSLNFLLQFNENIFRNLGNNTYINLDKFQQVDQLSTRSVLSDGRATNPSLNLTYTWRGQQTGEILRVIGSYNYSSNIYDRFFYQQFLNPDYTANGTDSTQQQLNDTRTNGYNLRVNYDKPVRENKTYISLGSFYNRSNSHVLVNTSYLKKPDNVYVPSELLSNDFLFHQTILNYRASVKQIIIEGFSVTAGTSVEQTAISFDLTKTENASNRYLTWLPFANINRYWKDKLNLSLAYRRSIRRPGIGELNPSIDYGDPYNIRFGNPYLQPSLSHNFDLVVGKTKDRYYANIGLGYNLVTAIYQQVRTLLTDGKTNITWENISNRREYEISTWSGYTFSQKLRLNASASYSYSVYSAFDRTVNHYRNGGTLTSNFNSNYAPSEWWNVNSSFTFNRFANPQGSVTSNISMNIAVQRKFIHKKLVITINAIDPIFQQKNRSFTYGSNFMVDAYSSTLTRNYRLTLSYNFTRTAKPLKLSAGDKSKLQELMAPKK